jgi:large subunit ribosomal protein L29
MAKEIQKLRGLSAEELTREELALRDEIWKLRLQRASGQLQNVHKIRRTRHELARLLTVRREMQGGGQ